MIANKQAEVTKDLANKKITVVREFDAPLEQVWHSWTDSNILDLWWAPRPWKTETKAMDFREGGQWLYQMVGPDGTGHWCCINYEKIIPNKSFAGIDTFCDENGKLTEEFPHMYWRVGFQETDTGTTVTIEINFSSVADLEKILEMGFEQGFLMALGNLDELLAK